jgi:hypothetical protein
MSKIGAMLRSFFELALLALEFSIGIPQFGKRELDHPLIMFIPNPTTPALSSLLVSYWPYDATSYVLANELYGT